MVEMSTKTHFLLLLCFAISIPPSLAQEDPSFSFTFEDIFGQLLGRTPLGHPCNETARGIGQCRFLLYCYNGTCQCPYPEISMYQNGACKVKAGERCLFKRHHYNGWTGFQTFVSEQDCVQNSVCQENFCQCLPGFYKTENGTCVLTLEIGEPCGSDLECDSELYLTCNSTSKTCRCGNERGSECGLPLYWPCGAEDRCQRNADCLDGLCQCNSDYFRKFVRRGWFSQTVCQKTRVNYFNDTCEVDDDCHADNNDFAFVCNAAGRCDCSRTRPLFRKQERGRGGVCVQELGGACHNERDCDKNTDCRWDSNGRAPTCACKTTYFVTAEGKCEPTPGNQEGS